MRKTIAAAIAAAAITVSGSAAASASASAPRYERPSCASQLAAIRKVGRQAGIRIGSDHLAAITDTSPETWARELRHAGITDGSEWAALHIRSLATAQRFVAYLEQDAAGALLGRYCSR
jgi:hypothetical protein